MDVIDFLNSPKKDVFSNNIFLGRNGSSTTMGTFENAALLPKGKVSRQINCPISRN